jgi:hypothetical protein
VEQLKPRRFIVHMPPLLRVFNRVGPRNPNTVIAQLAELTQRHWEGTAYDGFHLYDGKPPSWSPA